MEQCKADWSHTAHKHMSRHTDHAQETSAITKLFTTPVDKTRGKT